MAARLLLLGMRQGTDDGPDGIAHQHAGRLSRHRAARRHADYCPLGLLRVAGGKLEGVQEENLALPPSERLLAL